MKCKLCSKKVTRSQIQYGDAIRMSDGTYAHTDCLDDQQRHPRDAYYRDARGQLVNRR